MYVEFEDLIGKPFKYGGRGTEHYDCYGLVKEIYRRHGIVLPEFQSTDDKCTIANSICIGEQFCEKLDKPEIPCIVTFWIKHKNLTTHMGVMVDHNRFIHVTEKSSVIVSKLSSPLWNKRITGFYRWIKNSK